MFSRPSAEQLRTAEEALTAGRLEDAVNILEVGGFVGHRRAEGLLERLVDALLDRGQELLMSRRFNDAMADFNRAARCGVRPDAVGQWQRRAKEAIQHDAKLAGDQRAALDEARRKLAAGSIAGAENAHARAPMNNSEAAGVSDAIASQAIRAKASLDAARQALEHGDLPAAINGLRLAKQLDAKQPGMTETESLISNHVLALVQNDFRAGKLSRAEEQLRNLGDVGNGRVDRRELEDGLRLSRQAAEAMTRGDYAKSVVLLGRIAQIGLEAPWLETTRRQLDVIDDQRKALLEGPLGLLGGAEICERNRDETRTLPARVANERKAFQLPNHCDQPNETPVLPKRLVLRIDGAGSFLLLRGDRIGVGRMGSKTADLELISDLSERQAELIRAAEDYFVAAHGGVELAGRPVDHALLQDGDRIRLGNRVRMTFRRPSLKSSTAVLDLGEGVRTVGDCRRVVLWSGPILLGATRECHIQLPPTIGGLILLDRGGQLVARPMGPAGESVVLPVGRAVEIGDLRLSLHGWTSGSSAGRVIG